MPNPERWIGSSASAPASRTSRTFLAQVARQTSSSHTVMLADWAIQPQRRRSSTGRSVSAAAACCNAGMAAACPSVVEPGEAVEQQI